MLFFLLYCLSLPLIANMESILYLWLGKEQVNYEMVRFCQLLLVYSLINALEQPVTQSVRATGKIKKYQIQIGILTLTFIPICYIAFRIGLPAYTSMVILSLIYLIAQFVRVYIVKGIINISIFMYIKKVLQPIIFVVIVSSVVTFFINKFDNSDILEIFCQIVLELISTLVVIFLIGMSNRERHLICTYIRKSIGL